MGGGDSAIEAALALADQPGNAVRIPYRGDSFRRLKPANLERVETAVAAGRLEILWNTTAAAVHADSVTLRNGGESPVEVPADQVFVFIGGELPTVFLRECGIELETHFGKP